MKQFLFSTSIRRIIFMIRKPWVRKTEMESGVTVQVVRMLLTFWGLIMEFSYSPDAVNGSNKTMIFFLIEDKRKFFFFIRELWRVIIVWNGQGNSWQWQTIHILSRYMMKKYLMDKLKKACKWHWCWISKHWLE